jgi:hypothetical protein
MYAFIFCTLLEVYTRHRHIRAADLAYMCNPTCWRVKLKSLWNSHAVTEHRLAWTLFVLRQLLIPCYPVFLQHITQMQVVSEATQRGKTCTHGLTHQLSMILCPQCWYLSHLLRSSLAVENYVMEETTWELQVLEARYALATQRLALTIRLLCLHNFFSANYYFNMAGGRVKSGWNITDTQTRQAGVSPPSFVN